MISENGIICPDCGTDYAGKSVCKCLTKPELRWQNFQNCLAEWSDETFGSNRPPERTFTHLEEEVQELKADPRDIMEYADCFILLIDCLRRAGYNMEDIYKACREKLEICKKRKWSKPDENGKCNHIPESQVVE